MKVIEVVAAIIHDEEGRIFATQRGYGPMKDGWEFPGGKMESGETPEEALKREIWEELDEIERGILTCLKINGKVGRAELEKYTKKSRGTVISRLNNLMEKGIIKVNGDIHDPTRTYELV